MKRQCNVRKAQVGPVKPFAHKHSTMVGAVCRQVPPLRHVVLEQIAAKSSISVYQEHSFTPSYSIHIVLQQNLMDKYIEQYCH